MGKDLTTLIDESINLELNVANLYLLFHELFQEDRSFWWKLIMEEEGHAALLRSGKELFLPRNKFPHDLIDDRLRLLVDTNSRVHSLIEECEINPPSREEAFNIAFSLENSAGELHFQRFMDGEPSSKMDAIFQELNKDDKNHAERISSYMNSHGILLQSEKAKKTS